MIAAVVGRLAARRRRRARDRAVVGLLTSVYFQAYGGSFRVRLERRAGETEEAHASRELVAENQHQAAALAAIGLMVRNELVARGLEHMMGEDPPPPSAPASAVSTLKRTITEQPE